MGAGTSRSAEYFDGWYADMVTSAAKDDIAQRHLGLPAHLLSSSLLTWDGIADVVDALRLSAGQVLLDLACGRGGYGLEVAARTEAELIGSTSRPRRSGRPGSRRNGCVRGRGSRSGTWPEPDWTTTRYTP